MFGNLIYRPSNEDIEDLGEMSFEARPVSGDFIKLGDKVWKVRYCCHVKMDSMDFNDSMYFLVYVDKSPIVFKIKT